MLSYLWHIAAGARRAICTVDTPPARVHNAPHTPHPTPAPPTRHLPGPAPMTPKGITLTLGANGALLMAIPHDSGGTHTVTLPLAPEKAIDAITRVLLSQATLAAMTGTPSAPTQAEIDHRARHALVPDPSWCVFCQALARAAEASVRRTRAKPKGQVVLAEHSGVTVRRIPPKRRPGDPRPKADDLTLADLGLA